MDRIWVYLETTPLFGIALTLGAYALGDAIYRWLKLNPLANPVPIAIVIVSIGLWGTGIEYDRYFDGAQFIHVLLGPATVALAVPLYRQMRTLKRSLVAIVTAVIAGSLSASVSAVAIAWALGASPSTLASLAPKSVTTPIAMGVAEQIGGVPALTAVMVILTGITGAVLGPFVLNRLGITDWSVRGFAMGVAAHGIGTARALQVNPVAGAFAGLAIGLNGLATAVLLPLLSSLL